ncbi:hypothetical protein PA15_0329915 [Pseudomonas aeruginosa HB15]|nr:hypothetical protein PA15_0329915 [Pseudomonas aeruginosa HB15]KAJ16488.1 hypothetical protein M002_31075 [Pseudomonas aeruginosa ID4365]
MVETVVMETGAATVAAMATVMEEGTAMEMAVVMETATVMGTVMAMETATATAMAMAMATGMRMASVTRPRTPVASRLRFLVRRAKPRCSAKATPFSAPSCDSRSRRVVTLRK